MNVDQRCGGFVGVAGGRNVGHGREIIQESCRLIGRPGCHRRVELGGALGECEKMARSQPARRLRANFGREVLGAFMYMHMFAFRWKPGVTEEQKRRVAAGIRALQGQIPGLLETAVGMNISPRGGGYELGGAMKFADKAALERDGGHPVHQKLLSWLMPLIEPIEVDFEIRGG